MGGGLECFGDGGSDEDSTAAFGGGAVGDASCAAFDDATSAASTFEDAPNTGRR